MVLACKKIPIRKTPSRKIEVRDDHGVDYEDNLFEMIDDAQYESHIDPIKFKSSSMMLKNRFIRVVLDSLSCQHYLDFII